METAQEWEVDIKLRAGVGGSPKMFKLELQTVRLQADRPKCPGIPAYEGEEGDIAGNI